MWRGASLGAIGALALVIGVPSAGGFGTLDNGFGSGGVLLRSVGDGGQSAGNGLAVAPNGELRVAGEATDTNESKFALLRMNANATPTSVAATLTPLGGEAAGTAIFTQADGKAVVAGYGLGATAFDITRYLGDGSLDTGFGLGGIRQAPLGSEGDSAARAVAAYPPDMLVAAGRALDGGVVKVALVRLLGDGSIDPAFSALFAAGDGGEATADAVAVQADGKVVAAGYARDAGVIKLAVMRRLGNGSADSGFGNPTGNVLMAIGDGHEAVANALAIQPDGKLVVAGSVRDGGATKAMLARFRPDGSPDVSFGSGGVVLSSIGDGDDVAASAVAVEADGRIVVAGHATDSGGTNVMVARYNADGSPDTSFGSGGVSLVPLGDDGVAEANALALQGSRVVVTGFASLGGENETALVGLTLLPPSAAATPTAGGATPRDTTPPVLTASLTHRRFRVGKGASAFTARRRAPVGTTFRYTLSEAAQVTIRLERALPGVRRGKRCLKPSRRRRRGKRCVRYVRVGQLVRASPQGKSNVPFNGRVKRKALARGPYRAVLRAVDGAGNASPARTLSLEVVR